jgi:hypothetical protein
VPGVGPPRGETRRRESSGSGRGCGSARCRLVCSGARGRGGCRAAACGGAWSSAAQVGPTMVYLTVGNRPYRPGAAGYRRVSSKNFEFEFQKLKNVGKSLKILRDLLSLMVSNLLQTSFI